MDKKYKIKAQLIPFSIQKELDNGAFLKEDTIVIKLNNEEFSMSISNLKLQGKHNVKNAYGSCIWQPIVKVRSQSIKDSLANFEGAEHRLENVQKVNGFNILMIHKATNVNATFYALECMDNPTVWIVGGVDKGNDYEDYYL